MSSGIATILVAAAIVAATVVSDDTPLVRQSEALAIGVAGSLALAAAGGAAGGGIGGLALVALLQPLVYRTVSNIDEKKWGSR